MKNTRERWILTNIVQQDEDGLWYRWQKRAGKDP
jgi:hypothetical protein